MTSCSPHPPARHQELIRVTTFTGKYSQTAPLSPGKGPQNLHQNISFPHWFEFSSPVCVLEDLGALHLGSLVPGTEWVGVRPNDCGMELKSTPAVQTRTPRPGTLNFREEAQLLRRTLSASALATPSSLSVGSGWRGSGPASALVARRAETLTSLRRGWAGKAPWSRCSMKLEFKR